MENQYELFPGVTVTVDPERLTVEGGYGLQAPFIQIADYRVTLNLIITHIAEKTEHRFDGAIVLRSK